MPYQFNPPYSVEDFSGGFNDNYIDGPQNAGQSYDNLLIQKNKKLISVPGTTIYDSSNPQVLNGANRIGKLINHPQDQLFIQSENHLYYIASGSMVELTGPTGGTAFYGNGDANYISIAKWKNHVYAVTDNLTNPIKFYSDNSTVWQVNQAGLPDLASSPTISGSAGSLNYLYKFFYKHTYYVGSIQFEVDGPTTLVEKDLVTNGTKSISSIPVLANGVSGLYATAVITVEIYRTEGNGTTFYRVGNVTNGTTTFSDTVTDANLVNNATIYTAGGVLDRDPAPPAKFIHIVNGVAFYAAVTESSINYPNRWRQSVPGSPDHCPGSLTDDLEFNFTGINSIGIYPIFFCRDKMYRLEGIFDETGNGNPQTREISRTKGCISNNGIVQIPGGLVFPGIDQFYFTDGYSVSPIDVHHIESYKNLVSQSDFEQKITGRYDSRENRVHWCVPDETSTGDNNALWILDLNFQNALSPMSTFTKRKNVNSWNPTDIEFIGTDLIIADTRGYIFKQDTSIQTDPEIDTTKAVSLWNTNAVIWNYKSCATSFGNTKYFKFVPSIDLQAKNISNVTIQVNSCNEDSNSFVPLKEMRSRDGIPWGTPGILWGVSDIFWNILKMLRYLRRFPSGNLRTVYKQIQITNAYTIIYASDQLSTGNIDTTAKTLTLIDAAQSFGSEIVNYFVSFESDDYERQYLITSRNSDIKLTYSDPANTSTAGTTTTGYAEFQLSTSQISLGTTGFNPDHNQAWSVSAWVKSDGTGNFPDLISSYNNPGLDPYLLISPDVSGVGVYFANSVTQQAQIYANITLADSTWYHVTVTHDGTGISAGLSVYVNGTYISDVSSSGDNLAGATTVSPNNVLIGDGANGGFGFVDNVGIFATYKVSVPEVLAIYQLGQSGNLAALSSYSHLTYWYKMDGNSDDSKGSHNGTSTDIIYSGPSKWQISGYSKNEQLNLLSYSIPNAFVGENKTVWRGVTGGNT